MARLTMAQRRSLPKSDFAVPSKAPGPGSYPMPDKKHAVIAEGLAAMPHSGNQSAVRKKAKAKFGVGKKKSMGRSERNFYGV